MRISQSEFSFQSSRALEPNNITLASIGIMANAVSVIFLTTSVFISLYFERLLYFKKVTISYTN